MVKLVLKGERPKSMNEFWSGMHFRDRSKYAKLCHQLVKIESSNQLGHDFTIDDHDYPLFAIYVAHRKGRRKMDWSNVLIKPYEDGLVQSGVLGEDNPDYVVGGARFIVMDADEDKLEIIYCKPQEAPAIIQHIVTKYFT